MPKQLRFDISTPMEKLLAMDQIYYHKPISIVKHFFEMWMAIRPHADENILIYPRYPNGWMAKVLAEDKVWTVECDRGNIWLTRVADFIGHASNGGFITAAEEPADMWNEYQQPCDIRGLNNGVSIMCVDLCTDNDGDSFCCRCCPFSKNPIDGIYSQGE